MTELRLGAIADVDFHLHPAIVILPNALALPADRDESVEDTGQSLPKTLMKQLTFPLGLFEPADGDIRVSPKADQEASNEEAHPELVRVTGK